MKFKIKKNKIIKEIEKILKLTLSKKSLTPTLSGILFIVKKEKIILISSDSITSIKTELNIKKISNLEILKEGKFLIVGRYLYSILKKMDNEIIEFEKIENNILEIKTQKFTSRLNIMDENIYEIPQFNNNGNIVEINSKDFYNSLIKTLFCINREDNRIILTGINLKYIKNNLYFTATDSFRLSYKKITTDKNNSNALNITIPFNFANIIIKIIKEEKIPNNLNLIISNKQISIILNNAIIQSQVIKGIYPNPKKIIPTNFNSSIIINKIELLNIIERVTSLIVYENNSFIKLKIENNKIIISSWVKTIFNNQEIIYDFILKGQEQEIVLNSRFLIDSLRSFDCEKVLLKIIDSQNPILIEKEDNEDEIQLILPIRIN